jgi:putative hydrolase of the HAD superfamily
MTTPARRAGRTSAGSRSSSEIDAVFFDIDDTLLDDAAAQRSAAAVLSDLVGMDADAETFADLWSVVSQHHYTRYLRGELDFQEQRRARIREAVDGTLDDPAADALFASYLVAYESAWALCADAEACLDALGTRYGLGVVSNGQETQQRRKLETLAIADHFACVVISGDLGHRKPSPEIFLEACARLGTPPRKAAYVGDRYEIDALGARAAGLTGVWLDRLGSRGSDHAPPVISSLGELQGVLEAAGPARQQSGRPP